MPISLWRGKSGSFAAIPPQLGCKGVTAEPTLVVGVDTTPETSLLVRYSIAEVAEAVWFRRKLTLATLAAAFLIAVLRLRVLEEAQ